jgi:hypothetical protein
MLPLLSTVVVAEVPVAEQISLVSTAPSTILNFSLASIPRATLHRYPTFAGVWCEKGCAACWKRVLCSCCRLTVSHNRCPSPMAGREEGKLLPLSHTELRGIGNARWCVNYS